MPVGWDVDVVAMTQATPATEPGLVNCTNQLHGTVIGTSGSWSNSGNTIAKVFDGNLNTYFDGPDNSGDWVGLDFGAGVSNVIGQINYWPRIGWSARMLGGVFQGDNSLTFPNPVTLFTIATAPPENDVVTPQTITITKAFRCVRYAGPANGNCDVAELQFFAPNQSPASLTISGEPVWTPPTNYVGGSANATVTAAGATYYQWKAGLNGNYTNLADGANITGSATATLTINSVQLSNALDYVVVVTNISGAATSAPPATLYVLPPGPASNFTLNYGGATVVEGASADWNNGNVWNPGGASATTSAIEFPGSSFEVVPGTQLRTPVSSTYDAFPGGMLTVDGNGVFTNATGAGETTVGLIQFKEVFSPTTNYFPLLVMAGGQLDNGGVGTNASGAAASMILVQGIVNIESNTPMYVDSAGGINRAFQIDAFLEGNGSIEYHDFPETNDAMFGGLLITGSTNTYSGTWNVVQGPLVGSGANSLGTNTITINTNGVLETTYPINNTNSSLILNGRMFLTQTDVFQSVVINGTPLPAGIYTAAQLNSINACAFPLTFIALYGTTATSASGVIKVGSVVVLPSSPRLTSIQVSGTGGLTLSATNGTPGGFWTLLQSSNVARPLNQWQTNATGTFDGSGNLSTNILNAATNTQNFYILKVQ